MSPRGADGDGDRREEAGDEIGGELRAGRDLKLGFEAPGGFPGIDPRGREEPVTREQPARTGAQRVGRPDMVEGVAESERVKIETVLLQARDVGAAIVDEASERGADLLVLGLPYRKRFGGDFAIGRTVPYVLKNAPCAVMVVREPMTEESQA